MHNNREPFKRQEVGEEYSRVAVMCSDTIPAVHQQSNSMTTRELVEARLSAPPCRKCHDRTSAIITRTCNRNRNGGRPYWKCLPYNKFHGFGDERGDHPSNPLCLCGAPSKLQVSGQHKQPQRGLHYVCKRGICAFYSLCMDTQGRQVSVGEDLLSQ